MKSNCPVCFKTCVVVLTLTGLILIEILTGEKHEHLLHQDFKTSPLQSSQIIGTATIYSGTQ